MVVTIAPKEMRLKIINTTSEKLTQGSEIWLEAKLIIFKIRWHSLIRSLKPYQYLDEMVKGPFKRWTHLHIFHSINDQKQTEVLDEINFEIPYGRVGKLFEGYAYTQWKSTMENAFLPIYKDSPIPKLLTHTSNTTPIYKDGNHLIK